MKKIQRARLYKYLVYVVLFLLINMAATTLFFRIDLTKEGLYSISEVSKQVVSTLKEPLTIHVFFTENLPAPHNTTERYLRDLLEEYAIYGNRYFNFLFHDVSVAEGDVETQSDAQEMAHDYGVYPVQIQNIEQDEIKFQKAYMGMALIHGDMVEKIPTITSTEGLEYKITTAMQKMNNKISALLRLEDPIKVSLFLSSSLEIVAPYINISDIDQLPEKVEDVVDALNERHYGKLEYVHLDPTRDEAAAEEQQKYNLFRLQWEKQVDPMGKEIPEGMGVAGLVIENSNDQTEIPLIQTVNIPLFGTQYKQVPMENLEEIISESIEGLININEDIGYMSGAGTLPLMGGFMPQQQQQVESANSFNQIVSQTYNLKQINLADEKIPPGIGCLVIARPKEELSDYELFQIDQFLMEGGSVALFLDGFNEIRAQNSQQQYFNRNQGPFYLPLKTGLEKLLDHYGVQLKHSYVLDENCYSQRIDQRYGGGEQPIYFAPVIRESSINHQFDFMRNFERLVMFKISPLESKSETLEENSLQCHTLLKSSQKAWEMSGRINLNPYLIQKPGSEDEYGQFDLCYLVEGEFPSYFADKPVPVREQKADEAEGEPEAEETEESRSEKPLIDMSKVEGRRDVIKKGKPARLFLIATSEVIKDNLLGEQAESPNAIFVMNVLDYLNGREDIAVMRGKRQRFNLLEDVSGGNRTFVKTFSILGLPLLVVAAGLFIWSRRKKRMKAINVSYSTVKEG